MFIDIAKSVSLFIVTTICCYVIILLILALTATNVKADHNVFHTDENIMIVPIIRVKDGDTIETSISLPSPLNKLSIRIGKINTPESTWRARCPFEKALGLEASEFLKAYLKNEKIMILKNFKYGAFAGRIVSDVEVNGIDIGELMISKHYAVPYGTDKNHWCK